MCEYCNLEDYAGDLLPFNNKIKNDKQDYEVYLLDDIDYEQYSLTIEGTYMEIRIKINYCPMCGKQLGY